MNNYENRKIQRCQCCCNCKHGRSYTASDEEFTFRYCMLDVTDDDLKHIAETLYEDADFDERMRDIFGVNDNDWLEESHRLCEPDNVCQFYEKE